MSDKGNAAKDNTELLLQYKDQPGKLTATQKDKLISEYAPLIKFIARRIAVRLPSNIDIDDLISSGLVGLLDAIEKYDSTRDNKFKTYAEFRIRGAMLDELRSQDWVPRSVRDKAKLLNQTIARLETQKGSAPTTEEVAAELNMSESAYHELVNQVQPVSLLNIDETAGFGAGDKRSLLGLIEVCRTNNPSQALDQKSLRKVLMKVISDLPERQRVVLSLYYYEERNLKEIGKILSVTDSRVSQIHAQAIVRLRSKLALYMEKELI